MRYLYHRGKKSKEVKENTVRSLMDGLNDEGYAGVEFDVRMTKDEKIVIIHDKYINRTSNGNGKVCDMTYNELLEYNFSSNKYPEKICLLEDFFKQVKSNKILLLEIKEDKRVDELVFRLNEVIKKFLNINLYISSFDSKVLLKLKELNNSLKIGLILWFVKLDDKLKEYDFLELRQTNIDDVVNDFITSNNQELIMWNVLNKNKNPYNAIMIIENAII